MKTLGQIAFENDDDWAGEPETWNDLAPVQQGQYEKMAKAVAEEAVRRERDRLSEMWKRQLWLEWRQPSADPPYRSTPYGTAKPLPPNPEVTA